MGQTQVLRRSQSFRSGERFVGQGLDRLLPREIGDCGSPEEGGPWFHRREEPLKNKQLNRITDKDIPGREHPLNLGNIPEWDMREMAESKVSGNAVSPFIAFAVICCHMLADRHGPDE